MPSELKIVRNDITTLHVEAIVNTANETFLDRATVWHKTADMNLAFLATPQTSGVHAPIPRVHNARETDFLDRVKNVPGYTALDSRSRH
jgi:hypothetical protein